MRKKFFLYFLLLGFVMISWGQKKNVPSQTGTPNTLVKIYSQKDSIQYILGSYVAQWIISNGFQINNANLFAKAMEDVFQNKNRLIPDSMVVPFLDTYQKSTQKERASKQEQQLFASLKDKPGIGQFPNGVRYTILKAGKGPRPYEKDSIILHLTAKLPDGTVVEDTYKANKPFAASPTSFFPGLNETLLEMGEGAKWTLYVPSVLAYGEKGSGSIPPNSALILEVELLEVRPAKK